MDKNISPEFQLPKRLETFPFSAKCNYCGQTISEQFTDRNKKEALNNFFQSLIFSHPLICPQGKGGKPEDYTLL